jgi:FKBP-type peptidyl-prolyl cis-trans isomerase
MKKLFVSVLSLFIAGFLLAQTAAKPKPKAPVAPPPVLLKNLSDSTSYAIGVSVASFYKEQGISTINSTLLAQAVKDIMAGKTPKLDEATCNVIMNKAMTKAQEGKSQANINEGVAFLAKNKSKAGVITTASGLQYEVITQGTGIKPSVNDTFVCHYRGTLLNGTEFDASYGRGQPLVYPVNQVIKGWIEGLQLMPVGSKYKFYIPYELAYGDFDNGPIPGGSMLIFEMELLDIKKATTN